MNSKKRIPVISIICYVLAAIFAIIFMWLLGSSISYINDYLAQAGIGFGDMASDALKYIIAQSAPYLFNAVILVAAGRILQVVTPVKDAIGVVEEITDIEVSEAFDSVEDAVEAVKEAEEAIEETVEEVVAETVEETAEETVEEAAVEAEEKIEL